MHYVKKKKGEKHIGVSYDNLISAPRLLLGSTRASRSAVASTIWKLCSVSHSLSNRLSSRPRGIRHFKFCRANLKFGGGGADDVSSGWLALASPTLLSICPLPWEPGLSPTTIIMHACLFSVGSLCGNEDVRRVSVVSLHCFCVMRYRWNTASRRPSSAGGA